MNAAPSPIIPSLVARHAEDAAFYWARFMEGTRSPLHDMRSLLRFEQLLQAHLEGLRVAGAENQESAGWRATASRLQQWRTADEAFVGSILALEAAAHAKDTQHPLLTAMETFAIAAPEVARGLASACAWLDVEQVQFLIRSWAQSGNPILNRMALSAFAAHRIPAGEALNAWIEHADAKVRARALRAAGEVGTAAIVKPLTAHLSDPDADCRRWAAWSLALLGRGDGAEILADWAGQSNNIEQAMDATAAWTQVQSDDVLRKGVESALNKPEYRRLGLTVIRFSGDVRWADTLLELAGQREHARLAANVFAHLTGMPLTLPGVWLRPREDEDDGQEEDASMPIAQKQDADEGLLWPDVSVMKGWWMTQRAQFTDNQRYLAGKPLVGEGALTVLADPAATQLQRQHAALFLRCSRSMPILFDVRASMMRQRARLKAWPICTNGA